MKLSADGSTIAAFRSPCCHYVDLHVYKFISGDWVQIGSVLGIELYSTVDISGDGTTVAIYRPGYEGLAQVYILLPGPWRLVQLGTDIPIGTLDVYFSTNPALSWNGTILAIGNQGKSGHSVRVYKLQSSELRWLQLGSDISFGKYAGLHVSLSSDGGSLAVNFENKYINVYRFSPTLNRWEKLGSGIVLSHGYHRIDLSGDGTTIVIGDLTFSQGAFFEIGRVQIFKFFPSLSRWLQIGSNIVGKSNSDYVGGSVAVSSDGTTVVVGSHGVDEYRGEVRVFQLEPIVRPCNITWNLYNSRTDTLVGAIRNGTIFSNPPPCNYSNIQAVIRVCTVVDNTVVMRLYTSDMKQLLHENVERGPRYFLFGNNATNINNGRIIPGTYNVQVTANGIRSRPTRFTINDNGSCS